MPLPLPKLDNRTFDQLFEEGRSLIPRHAPEWTDHNYSDPGITLLDLLAWLFEADLYRLDVVQEASYRGFLRLVGVEPRGPQPAQAVLVWQLQAGEPPLNLPEGIQVGDTKNGLVFQSLRPLAVTPARLAEVRAQSAGRWFAYGAENAVRGQKFPPFGSQPQPGAALYLDFDAPLDPAEAEISLYVWVDPEADWMTRQALIEEWQAEMDDAQAACPPGLEPNIPGWWLHYSARTVWEYRRGPQEWAPLETVVDETRGLSLSGPVRFTAPGDLAPDAEGRFSIRCRLISGGYECPPLVDRIAVNAMLCAHSADIEGEEILGLSRGHPGQFFRVGQPPVVPGSAKLRTILNGSEQQWQEVRFWDRSGPHAWDYRLEHETGAIVFGDGRVGRVPPAGSEVRVQYRVGGGAEGNIPAGRLTTSLNNAHNQGLVSGWEGLLDKLIIEQPYPAQGGAPAETLAEARGRALDGLGQRHRGVTSADFAELARQAPGIPVARARVLPNRHPDLPCFPATGSLTVVVVPNCPGPRPEPGPDFLRAVERYLDRRRSLTAEVHVTGPCFLPVTVHAHLHVRPGTDTGALTARARKALEDFFHPLTGGPEGAGWPIGRHVYRAEVFSLLSAITGVEYVDDLGLQGQDDREPRCANLPVCPDCLVVSGDHQIQISPVRPAERSNNR